VGAASLLGAIKSEAMKRYVIISTEQELHSVWQDPALPHMSFNFREDWIDECEPLGDDLYVATYDTYMVHDTSIINYYDARDSDYKSVTVEPGEYGLRPTDPGMTHAEFVHFLSTRTP
jgi:hypothetical protein